MTARNWQNLVEMFIDQLERFGDKPFLLAKTGQAYQSQSWREVGEQVAKLAAALREMGVQAGDRVALVSENRPEWLIADFAIMAAGGVSVPMYTTSTPHDHLHILENSGAKGVIVSTQALAAKVLPLAHQLNTVNFVIAIDPPQISQRLNVNIHDWKSVIARSSGTISEVAQRARPLKRPDTACITYTSGTGGAPKGVMIHHGALLHNCEGAADVVKGLKIKNYIFLSFLPLSHAYEHLAGQFLPMAIGGRIAYAEGVEKLATNLTEVRPTIMTAMPRLFELFRSRILRAIKDKGGLSEKLFMRALELGTRKHQQPRTMSLREKLENLLLDLLVRRKVRKRFGGRLAAFVSGGAPLYAEVGLFFQALGVQLLQGYGQTESAPLISVNRPGSAKMHTVGPPVRNTEVRIAEDGEILVRGELVTHGYWRDAEATAKAIRDGWLHTGDIGILDDDGHLEITDRKKDIIVNDKGDNVSPQRIEGMLTLEPEIAQAMVYGDRKPHLVGLLVPDAEWMRSWARANDQQNDFQQLTSNPAFRRAIDAAVSRLNKRLSNLERVRRFTFATEPFTIENEQMTPTLKVRRHKVIETYRDQLEALY
ncbi:MAG: AMP-dependent synthetase/ligase [Sphingomonadales bacterium]